MRKYLVPVKATTSASTTTTTRASKRKFSQLSSITTTTTTRVRTLDLTSDKESSDDIDSTVTSAKRRRLQARDSQPFGFSSGPCSTLHSSTIEESTFESSRANALADCQCDESSHSATSVCSDSFIDTLKARFGLHSFRPVQREAIEAIVNFRKDVLLLMPTGGGKSLCFQLPPLIQGRLGVVISPLISLMKNHIDDLQNRGIEAVVLNSTVPKAESALILDTLRRMGAQGTDSTHSSSKGFNSDWAPVFATPQPKIEILYTTPETLLVNEMLKDALLHLYRSCLISCFAIDECHCVSSWGQDFRPKYRQLALLKGRYPNVPIVAVTATATTQVRADIIAQLRLQHPVILVGSFDRPNLFYSARFIELIQERFRLDGAKKPSVALSREQTTAIRLAASIRAPFEARAKGRAKKPKKKKRKRRRAAASAASKVDPVALDIRNFILTHYPLDTGIIYAFRRADTETLVTQLKDFVSIAAYHAGKSQSHRSAVQSAWEKGRIKVVAATIAFGMGIDKSNVRYIIHRDASKSLESYYQETGRAGRDGLPSAILCYYSPKIIQKYRRFAVEDEMFRMVKANRGLTHKRARALAKDSAKVHSDWDKMKSVEDLFLGVGCRRQKLLRYFADECKSAAKHCCDYCQNPTEARARINSFKVVYGQKSSKRKRGKQAGFQGKVSYAKPTIPSASTMPLPFTTSRPQYPSLFSTASSGRRSNSSRAMRAVRLASKSKRLPLTAATNRMPAIAHVSTDMQSTATALSSHRTVGSVCSSQRQADHRNEEWQLYLRDTALTANVLELETKHRAAACVMLAKKLRQTGVCQNASDLKEGVAFIEQRLVKSQQFKSKVDYLQCVKCETQRIDSAKHSGCYELWDAFIAEKLLETDLSLLG